MKATIRARFHAVVSRLSVKTFTGSIYILPFMAMDSEPGCWGYPGCKWVCVGWLRWSLQVSLYTRPCEHCFYYSANAANEPCSEAE
jgi:hypothetical protein